MPKRNIKDIYAVMKSISAFAYLYHYYAIPEEYASVDAFLADAARRPVLLLTRLCETGCIAPYFIEEETELTHIRLNEPDRIHCVEAYLMPREEYRSRLAELLRARCPGCLHSPVREGEPVDVDGHEREMTLDGLCLLRAEGSEPYTLIDAADDFWRAMLEAEDSIRKPLYDGNYTEAADALGGIYARFFPSARETVFSVNRVLGQHYLMFGALSPEARMINRYVISRAPEEVSGYWLLLDYLPRGVSRYERQTGYDLYETPPTVEFLRLPGKTPRYRLDVFCPTAVGGIRTAHETFRYLCAELGEELLAARVMELRIESTPDYGSHRPLREFLQTLRADNGFFFRRRLGREFSRSMELMLPAADGGSRAAAERMSSVTPALSLEIAGREFGGRLARVVDEWRLPVCTLALTLRAPERRERITAVICGEIAADLQRDGLILLLDIARTEDKLYLNFIASAAGESIEALRDLTPEFMGLDPILTVRTERESRVMRVNYTLDSLRRVSARREEAVQ